AEALRLTALTFRFAHPLPRLPEHPPSHERPTLPAKLRQTRGCRRTRRLERSPCRAGGTRRRGSDAPASVGAHVSDRPPLGARNRVVSSGGRRRRRRTAAVHLGHLLPHAR